MKKQETVNTFDDGLILDLNPLTVPNTALTNCLNGTFLTFNGNEGVLLNDMGNARVETAMLPTGYIPLGSTSFGGIIYIISYNPIEKKCLIGSFPSPERNLSKDELGNSDNTTIDLNNFVSNEWQGFESIDNIITNYYLKVNLLKTKIYAGDKYKVFSNQLDKKYISGWYSDNTDPNNYPKYLKFEIISTLDDGKTIELTNNSVWTSNKNDTPPYYIYDGEIKLDSGKISLEEYRGLVGSNYDTYSSKLSGQLGIVAKLEVPTLFTVGYNVLTEELGEDTKYTFYFLLNWSNDNKGELKNRINPQGVNISSSIEAKKQINSGGITTFSMLSPNISFGLNHGFDLLKNMFNYNKNVDILLKRTPKSGESANGEYFDTSDTLMDVDYYTNIMPLDDEKNSFSNDKFRENDGTDFQYALEGIEIYKNNQGNFYLVDGSEKYNINGNVLNLSFTPYMPFGKLLFLKRDLSLNLDLINTGNMYFNNYQYYVEKDKINIDFSLEAYPEQGRTIDGLSIKIEPLVGLSEEWLKQSIYDSELKSELNLDELTPLNISNPTGLLHIEINKEEHNLKENEIYVIHFIFKDTDGKDTRNRIFNRLLFNNTLFNNAYGQGQDFKDLYLYDTDNDGSPKNYGIKLDLNIDKFLNEECNVNPQSIDEYTLTSMKLRYNLSASINNHIELDFELITGLKDVELIYELDDINKEINYTHNLDLPDSPARLTVSGANINLEHDFMISIPVTVNYSKLNNLDIYKIVLLATNTSYHYRLLHYSQESDYGDFALIENKISNLKDQYLEKIKYPIANDSRNTNIFIDYMMLYLHDLLQSNELDYLNVLFGINYMGDEQCGYAYNNTGTNICYRFNRRPDKLYVTMTCLRKNESESIILHRIDTNTSPIPLSKPTGSNYENLVETDYYNDKVTLFYDSSGHRYYKYLNTFNKKTIYTLNEIEGKDFLLETVYNIQLKFKERPYVKIGDSDRMINSEDSVKNLTINNLNTIDLQITFNNKINVEDWIISKLENKDIEIVWDETNNKSIPSDNIYNVFKDNYGLTISKLYEINNNFIQIKPNVKLNKCIWVFAWENVHGNAASEISWGELTNDDKTQYYNLYNTYTISENDV